MHARAAHNRTTFTFDNVDDFMDLQRYNMTMTCLVRNLEQVYHACFSRL